MNMKHLCKYSAVFLIFCNLSCSVEPLDQKSIEESLATEVITFVTQALELKNYSKTSAINFLQDQNADLKKYSSAKPNPSQKINFTDRDIFSFTKTMPHSEESVFFGDCSERKGEYQSKLIGNLFPDLRGGPELSPKQTRTVTDVLTMRNCDIAFKFNESIDEDQLELYFKELFENRLGAETKSKLFLDRHVGVELQSPLVGEDRGKTYFSYRSKPPVFFSGIKVFRK